MSTTRQPPRTPARLASRSVNAPSHPPTTHTKPTGYKCWWREEWDAIPRIWAWHTLPLEMRRGWVIQLVSRVADNVPMDSAQAVELDRRLHIWRDVASANEEALKYGERVTPRAQEVSGRRSARWEERRHNVPPLSAILRHPRTMIPALARYILERARRRRDDRAAARIERLYTSFEIEVANIPVSQAGLFLHAHHVPRVEALAAWMRWCRRQRAIDRNASA